VHSKLSSVFRHGSITKIFRSIHKVQDITNCTVHSHDLWHAFMAN